MTVNVPVAPAARLSDAGDTLPNEAYCCVLASNGTLPAVPPSAPDSMPKITAVHRPATGLTTSTLPKLPTPCGSEWAANRPLGSIRISRTRALLPLPGFPG